MRNGTIKFVNIKLFLFEESFRLHCAEHINHKLIKLISLLLVDFNPSLNEVWGKDDSKANNREGLIHRVNFSFMDFQKPICYLIELQLIERDEDLCKSLLFDELL